MSKPLSDLTEAQLFTKLQKLRFEILALVQGRNKRQNFKRKQSFQARIDAKHKTYLKIDEQLQKVIDARQQREATEGNAVKIMPQVSFDVDPSKP